MWIAFAVHMFIHSENCIIQVINAKERFVVKVYRNGNMRWTTLTKWHEQPTSAAPQGALTEGVVPT